MKKLFDGVPLPQNFKNVTEQIYVLPVSLENFYQLFWGEDAPYFSDTYIEYSQPGKNFIESTSKWFSPPKEDFRTYDHFKCSEQRTIKYTIYANYLYPKLPQDQYNMICDRTETAMNIF